MQRRYVVRVIVLLAVLALAVVFGHAPRALGRGMRGVGRIQQPFTAVTMEVTAWFSAVGRVMRHPDRIVALERSLAELRTQHDASVRTVADLQEQLTEDRVALPPQLGVPIRAQVIAGTFSGSHRAVVVTYKLNHNIRPRDTVLARGALIGMITESGSTRATVQLLSDPQSRIGVELAAQHGAIGVLEADGGSGIVVSHIPVDRIVAVGDAVVTGITNDGIPPGIPIGTIAAIRTDSDGFFQTGIIDPIADPRRESMVTILAASRP